MCRGSEGGSYLRRIDLCITQPWAREMDHPPPTRWRGNIAHMTPKTKQIALATRKPRGLGDAIAFSRQIQSPKEHKIGGTRVPDSVHNTVNHFQHSSVGRHRVEGREHGAEVLAGVLRALSFGVLGLGFGVWGSGFGVWGLGFGV